MPFAQHALYTARSKRNKPALLLQLLFLLLNKGCDCKGSFLLWCTKCTAHGKSVAAGSRAYVLQCRRY